MRCPSCEFEVSVDLHFCGRCGTRLELRCRECGRASPLEYRFCGGCGKGLAESELVRPDDLRGAEGERRQLTILFCDLVGSTELAARLDPEEWRALVRAFEASASAVIGRHAGHVAQILGDGLLAYFGWPQAQGDDAERALRAALALVNPAEPRDPRIALRVGVHTGSVVVADIGSASHRETLALGDAPNIASRVQGFARAGEVLMTGATQRLVTGLFVTEERGAQRFKGLASPIELIAVVRALGRRRHMQQARTPFVGRDAERKALAERVELACRGEGQVALIVGEPGIGKSRLAQTMRDDHAHLPITWFEAAASAHNASTPFFAVSEVLKQAFAPFSGDPADEQIARLKRSLEDTAAFSREALSAIAPLLGVASPEGPGAAAAASPEAIHQGQLDALENWLVAISRFQPLAILIEDLQWADPSTLELAMRIAERAARAPILMVCTARPEFRAPWPLRAHHTQLTLSRLGEQRTRALVERVAAGRVLPSEVMRAVVQRADGVPIFAEELTKAALEVGARGAREIPDTLAGSLMARLDRLGPAAREAALVASVFGREFTRALLQAIHPVPEAELERALQKLVDAELVWVRGAAPDLTFTFKHALVADAAYEALLRTRRRDLHARAAGALRDKFPELASARPDSLAHHLGEAGEIEASADAWQRAGEIAMARGATSEAVRHFERALAQLAALGESPLRDARELRIQLARFQALTFARGAATPEAISLVDRAAQLGARVEDSTQQVLLLWALFSTVSSREGGAAALPIAQRMLAAAQDSGAQPLEVWAQFALGMCQYFAGELQSAYTAFTRSLERHDDASAVRVPIDPPVAVLPYLALTSWYLGRADEARAHAERAIARATRLGRPAERAWAGSFVALLSLMLREPGAAIGHADAVLAACRDEPNPINESMAKSLRGAALAMRGDVAAGVPLVREGVAMFRALGERISLESTLGYLVDSLAHAGELEEALELLDEAAGAVAGDQLHRPETLLRRGSLLERMGGPPRVAEAAYRAAIECARDQGALALELRAATTCARLLAAKGRAHEGRELLEPVFARVAEGFGTRDWIEARSLLASL